MPTPPGRCPTSVLLRLRPELRVCVCVVFVLHLTLCSPAAVGRHGSVDAMVLLQHADVSLLHGNLISFTPLVPPEAEKQAANAADVSFC